MIVSDSSQERAQSFRDDVRPVLNCDCLTTASPKDACQCDILVTTTPSRCPVVQDKWIRAGTHINAIGADARGKQELESSLTKGQSFRRRFDPGSTFRRSERSHFRRSAGAPGDLRPDRRNPDRQKTGTHQ